MISSEDFESTLTFLRKNEYLDYAKELAQLYCVQELRKSIAPDFYSQVEKCLTQISVTAVFMDGVAKLFAWLVEQIEKLTKIFDDDAFKKDVLLELRAQVFHTLPEPLRRLMQQFYTRAFAAYRQLKARRENVDDLSLPSPSTSGSDINKTCPSCEKPGIKCVCWSLLDKFGRVTLQISELELLERLTVDVIPALVQEVIAELVEVLPEVTSGGQNLSDLEEWLQDVVFGWLAEIYGRKNSSPRSARTKGQAISPAANTVASLSSGFDMQQKRIEHFFYEQYAKWLIRQFFAVIICYPDTSPAVEDLRLCLERVVLRKYLIDTLKDAFEQRLLHPGVNTMDILDAYIKAIRTLRALDPSGVVLDLVCQPIRKYLRQRHDTVRCIVSYITEDPNLDLSVELLKNESLLLDDSYQSDDDESDDWMAWEPEPVDADLSKDPRSRKSADIISMLVGIYGSKELFVREYCQLLCERLLKNFTYDIEREIRYLELLKRRFGENELHQCEVMLKDISDSQRIEQFVHSPERMGVNSPVPIGALVLSAQFWPTLKEERLNWPQVVKDSLESFVQCYEQFKASRTLDWRPTLGSVTLELELNGRSVRFVVGPVLASIIWMFQEKEAWHLEELSTSLHMPTSTLRRRLSFWQRQGLLHEEADGLYRLADDMPPTLVERRALQHGEHQEDDELDDSIMIEEKSKEDVLEGYWPYISGILRNLDGLTAERMHSMLRMFSHGEQHQVPSVDQVKKFMERKVKEQAVQLSGGVYKLIRNTV